MQPGFRTVVELAMNLFPAKLARSERGTLRRQAHHFVAKCLCRQLNSLQLNTEPPLFIDHLHSMAGVENHRDMAPAACVSMRLMWLLLRSLFKDHSVGDCDVADLVNKYTFCG